MLITIFLFIFYTVICSALLLQIPIIKKCALPNKIIIGLFIFKLLGGLLYHYILTVRFYGGDSHGMYVEIISQLQKLHSNPLAFYKFFFTEFSPFHLNENIFSDYNAKSWSDIGNNLNLRFMTIANILSFGNEVVNIIFYNFIFFIGQMALFQTFVNNYPSKKILFLISIFCIPSVWFWCSGIHKDGFVLSFIGFAIYYIHQFYNSHLKKHLIFTLIFLLLTISIRFYISLILLPAIILFVISKKYPKYSVPIFSMGILLFVFAFFNVNSVLKKINPPNIVCIKQSQFITLRGDSFIPTKKLEANSKSFLTELPSAYNKILMRPYIWEAKDIMYLLAGLETSFLFLIIIIGFIKSIKEKLKSPLILFSLFLCIFMFLIIGYIVPFSGAFIRYRSEYFPFLFSTLIAINSSTFLQKIETKLNNYILKLYLFFR